MPCAFLEHGKAAALHTPCSIGIVCFVHTSTAVRRPCTPGPHTLAAPALVSCGRRAGRARAGGGGGGGGGGLRAVSRALCENGSEMRDLRVSERETTQSTPPRLSISRCLVERVEPAAAVAPGGCSRQSAIDLPIQPTIKTPPLHLSSISSTTTSSTHPGCEKRKARCAHGADSSSVG